MLKIGLTGNLGSGKTTVASMFKVHGVKTIDVDELAHRLMKNDVSCKHAIAKAFGEHLIGKMGVDRVTLGKMVFDDPRALKTLEDILHPRIEQIIKEKIKGVKHGMVMVDAAILIEAGWHKLVDTVIVVKTRQEVAIKRAMMRTGLTKKEVLKRIKRQMPLQGKLKYADYVIDNSGTRIVTKDHVERIFRSLKQTPIL